MSEVSNEEDFQEVVDVLDELDLYGVYIGKYFTLSIDDFNRTPDFLESLVSWEEKCKKLLEAQTCGYLRTKILILEKKEYSACDCNSYYYLPYLAFCGIRLETEAERSARLEQAKSEQLKEKNKLKLKETEDLIEYERLKKKFEGKNNAL